MARFPDTLAFSGILRPLRFEGDILDLEVEGEVPPQLSGTYHRVHPDQQFAPRFDNEQFFNGDGMVSLFRFRHGRVDFKQRYAQTDKFKLERAAGRALFGAYRNPLTGNLVAFSYASKGLLTKDCTYMEISPTGELLREVWFETPYYCMMHDWGVTEDYACFHIVPSTSNWERLQANLPHFGFDTTLPVYLLVLPRKGDAKDIKIFKRPNMFCSHVMNAFNDGTKIYFDTPAAKNNMFPFFPDIHGAPFNRDEGRSYMTRWTVDYNSKSDEFENTEQLSQLFSEFPRIDDRYATQPHGHGWIPVTDMSMRGNSLNSWLSCSVFSNSSLLLL